MKALDVLEKTNIEKVPDLCDSRQAGGFHIRTRRSTPLHAPSGGNGSLPWQ
jgi:hypothetical protein